MPMWSVCFTITFVRQGQRVTVTDVRWMQLAEAGAVKSAFRSDASFQFSVIPFNDENLDGGNAYQSIMARGVVTVHLDAAQAGVGNGNLPVVRKYCRSIVYLCRITHSGLQSVL